MPKSLVETDGERAKKTTAKNHQQHWNGTNAISILKDSRFAFHVPMQMLLVVLMCVCVRMTMPPSNSFSWQIRRFLSTFDTYVEWWCSTFDGFSHFVFVLLSSHISSFDVVSNDYRLTSNVAGLFGLGLVCLASPHRNKYYAQFVCFAWHLHFRKRFLLHFRIVRLFIAFDKSKSILFSIWVCCSCCHHLMATKFCMLTLLFLFLQRIYCAHLKIPLQTLLLVLLFAYKPIKQTVALLAVLIFGFDNADNKHKNRRRFA